LVASPTEKEDIENDKIAAYNTVSKFEEVKIELPVKDLQRLKKNRCKPEFRIKT